MASGGRSQSVARAPEREAPVRAAEVIGAMSIATDLGTGQPLEHALRTAILAVRLGELAGLTPHELSDAYYISLLHSIGCTSDATEQTQLFGDDIEPRAKFALVDGGDYDELVDGLGDALIWEQAMDAEPPPQRRMTGDQIDAAFRVIGTFTDLKSYWLRGHAEGTSQLAEAAAWRLGLTEDEVTLVRRAAF